MPCDHADGNATIPAHFVEGRDLVIAPFTPFQVGVWDLDGNWQDTLKHSREVRAIAVSLRRFEPQQDLRSDIGIRRFHSHRRVRRRTPSLLKVLALPSR